MNRLKFFLFLISSVLMMNCSSDDEPKEVDIALKFQKHVDSFVKEAADRGIDIDFTDTGLSIQFGTVPSEAAGVCSELGGPMSGSHGITIRKTYWDQIIDSERERLIFHELGHCELNRPHDNQILSSGDWKSIMRGDPLPEGKSPLVNYSGTRRKHYVDELFDPTVASPDWNSISASYDDVPDSGKTEIFSIENVRVFSEFTSLTENIDFEIEVTMQQLDGLDFMGFLWAGGGIDNSLHLYFNEGDKLFISSGDLLYGHMHIINYDSNIAFQENKMTIRKQGNYYYYFLNEEFIYWTDFEELNSSKVESVVHNLVDATFKSVKVFTI